MSFHTKAEADDAQFVESVRDEEKRQARIERLSRSRRILRIVLSIQAVCICVIMFVHIIQTATHDPSTNSLSMESIWGTLAIEVAAYLYTDLQIKFLKADAARFAAYGVNQGGATSTS